LGQVGTDWQFSSLGGFFGSDTTDMLLRNSQTGGLEVYDISNNLITNAAFLGTVGLDWQAMGFGNFSSLGENDMILRNVNTGGVEVYDLRNNQITGANFMGTVGLNWQFSGVGNFSGRGTSDMILRSSNTGGLEVYDINNNQITGAAFWPCWWNRCSLSGGSFASKLGILHRRLLAIVRDDDVCRRLMTIPGVGPVVALTYRVTVDVPARFRNSKAVGAVFGLTPSKYQSGQNDRTGGISRCGDEMMRMMLYEAAQSMLVRSTKWSWLKAWAMKIARHRGMKKAIVALARRLAVIMHRIWVDGTEFRWTREVAAA
jgi:hypothetical protein